MKDITFINSLSANYTGEHFNFSSQTAYQENERTYTKPIDGDFSPADAVTIINNYGSPWNHVKVLTQECKFTSPATATKLKWTGGLYFFYQDNPVKQATRFGKDAALVGAPDSNFSVINTTKGTSTGEAVYGQLTWAVSKQFEITAGLRYDHEYQHQNVLSEYQHDPDPNPAFALIPDTSGSVSFNAFSPKLGFEWHLNRQTNLYVTYSRGYRPGGLTQVSSDPSQPPLYQFKPEHSDNIEAGMKNYFWGDRLLFNLAAFSTFISDAQVPTLVLPSAITVTKNAGRLTSKGVEAELAVKPVKGLEGSFNFGYTDATFQTLKLSSNGTETDLAGKRQVFTPDVTSSLALQYDYPLKKNINILIRGEWSYIGKQYFDLANTIAQDPYSLFNTRFGISEKHGELMFWIRNIGDKRYISYAYDFGAVHLGNPRTFGVTFLVKS
jgi:iron complex outermembrane receptor protein